MSIPGRLPWEDFSADPRDPAVASLRASDRDRDVVLNVLAEAYADGRLSREEYDDRAAVVGRAKTLGELPDVVGDLVLRTAASGTALVPASSEELREQAVRAYEASRREALSGILVPVAVLTVIWYVVSAPGFYWPIFVVLFGVANMLRVLLHKKDIVEREQRRLEKDQRKRLEPPNPT